MVLAATGCSSEAAGTPDAPGGTVDTKGMGPGAVAVQYSTALFSGRFPRAASFVLPRQRGVLKVLFTGMNNSSVRAQGLGLGSVHVKADSATVVLTGRMCSSGVIPKGATVRPRQNEKCVSNHRRDTSDPAFHVTACKSSGKWYVCFPKFDEAMRQGSASTATKAAPPSPRSSH
ncbi:hypothetical protein [Streptomyces sp. NPDC058294]|uniref:hypothetical protein n=1 Tax=Streptomyces sp. NPDC058294 TaxID=3346430 RepID=UPI0036E66F0E